MCPGELRVFFALYKQNNLLKEKFMKENVRRALAISGLAIALGTSGIVFDASANSGNNIKQSKHERFLRSKKIVQNSTTRHTGRRVFIGTVSNLTENSFTLTRATKTYTVNVTSETKILNHTWKSIALSDIKDGDKVRVLGTISDTIITAKKIRDISLQ